MSTEAEIDSAMRSVEFAVYMVRKIGVKDARPYLEFLLNESCRKARFWYVK